MLTEKQKKDIKNINNCTPRLRRSVRKRVTDKTGRSIKDLIFVLEHAEEFPNLMEKIPVEKTELY